MQKEVQEDRFFSEDDLNKELETTANHQFSGSTNGNVFIEQPISTKPETHPVNGKHGPDDEDEDEAEEDDLILGDEEAVGDEEEFDVELEGDFDEADIGEDDLVIDSDDDIEDEEDDL